MFATVSFYWGLGNLDIRRQTGRSLKRVAKIASAFPVNIIYRVEEVMLAVHNQSSIHLIEFTKKNKNSLIYSSNFNVFKVKLVREDKNGRM